MSDGLLMPGRVPVEHEDAARLVFVESIPIFILLAEHVHVQDVNFCSIHCWIIEAVQEVFNYP